MALMVVPAAVAQVLFRAVARAEQVILQPKALLKGITGVMDQQEPLLSEEAAVAALQPLGMAVPAVAAVQGVTALQALFPAHQLLMAVAAAVDLAPYRLLEE
jgi:hypothetical protein